MPQTLAADDIVETHAQGAGNGREPLLVLAPLRDYLSRSGLQAPDDLSAQPIGEGHSNVTFVLSTGVVLRRPPRGPLPPSAHDVLREARLLEALGATDVRTPKVLAVCADLDVIGAPFYVMELVAGDVITDSLPAEFDTDAQRSLVADELIDALVELHTADWNAIGLEGFGKPSGYLERQLRRFAGLWEHNRTRDLPAVEAVGRWLADNLPESGPATIVHGDYRLGNVLYAPASVESVGSADRVGSAGAVASPPRLAAILDWEMATIGDPLADLGYLLTNWYEAGDTRGLFTLQTVSALPGFPDRAELVRRYEQRSGRAMRAVDWYVTLAIWKGVVFMEGNYKRAVAGSTDDPYLRSFGDAVVSLAERALEVTRNGL
jgi:aminoglycoside phosphotransferase (APT) family kinase protein